MFVRRVLPVVLVLALPGCDAPPPEPNFGRKAQLVDPKAASELGRKALSAKDESHLARLAKAQAEAVQQAPAQPAAPKPVLKPRPDTPDPMGGKFTLAQALKGLPKRGTLTAVMKTNLGTLSCRLYEKKAPLTVANFVGLARGLRPFWHAAKGAWVTEPLYDGTTFHRVIPGFMIQGGDHLGDGTGEVGYNLRDELHPSLKHDRAGLLCMANRGPNTNGGQFFITDAAAPHLTAARTYSIFGECSPTSLVSKIARVPTGGRAGTKPIEDVVIQKVTIERR